MSKFLAIDFFRLVLLVSKVFFSSQIFRTDYTRLPLCGLLFFYIEISYAQCKKKTHLHTHKQMCGLKVSTWVLSSVRWFVFLFDSITFEMAEWWCCYWLCDKLEKDRKLSEVNLHSHLEHIVASHFATLNTTNSNQIVFGVFCLSEDRILIQVLSTGARPINRFSQPYNQKAIFHVDNVFV